MLVAMAMLAAGPVRAQSAAAGAPVSNAPPMAAPASTPGVAPAAGAPAAGAPAAVSPEAADLPDYKLGVADHVRINVYNEPDLSGEFTVSSTGTLSLPLIGSVPVAGKTASEAATSVQQRLLGRYLKEPHVSLEVLTYRPFFILGEVTRPGEYPYANGLTILNAVATAEGFTYRANKRRAFIKRSGQSGEQRVEIAPDTLVQPGDTIRIGERHF